MDGKRFYQIAQSARIKEKLEKGIVKIFLHKYLEDRSYRHKPKVVKKNILNK